MIDAPFATAVPESVHELSAYDFELPAEQIAQEPAPRRDQSRLLVLERATGRMEHRSAAELPELLRGDEMVVVNDTRVVPARLFAKKSTGGVVELLTLPPAQKCPPNERWAMYRCSGTLRAGMELLLADLQSADDVEQITIAEVREGRARLRFWRDALPVLERYGSVPLPPYIARPRGESNQDRTRYQTIYAATDKAASVAAPTAGLHFTPEMLARLDQRGIPVVRVTLHVGPGTFQPVRVSNLRLHCVEPEWSDIGDEAADALSKGLAEGRRILAVGTTTVRTLEGRVAATGALSAGTWLNDLTILPGFRFERVAALLTNFHLPRSSLLVLVASFAGHQRVLDAYRAAVRAGYRFYSYGDAMLIV